MTTRDPRLACPARQRNAEIFGRDLPAVDRTRTALVFSAEGIGSRARAVGDQSKADSSKVARPGPVSTRDPSARSSGGGRRSIGPRAWDGNSDGLFVLARNAMAASNRQRLSKHGDFARNAAESNRTVQ